MHEDDYLRSILAREAVNTGLLSPPRAAQFTLEPAIKRWANNFLVSVSPSGSFAKGTANKSGTDIDLLISVSHTCPNNLESIYETLAQALTENNYPIRRQNVSINVKVNGLDVDLVPAKRHDALSQDHSLWRRKAKTWTKTNVAKHIAHVTASRRMNEIRILKLWRSQQGLDFPSFYLELSVIEALSHGRAPGTLGRNVMTALHYLRDRFPNARIIDPANTNNIISEDLTDSERATIQQAAKRAAAEPYWEGIVK
ncbi:MAG: nucleotidyltransferase domain-containing protein [Nitrospira sp.]|nr:nucleotidyltransferase domain-containing protein [Nitrospira sp.]